jgi:hypothetical protein
VGAVVGVVLMLLLTACHVKVQVDAKVNPDGSGTVTVGVGLDHDAMSQVGDLRSELRVTDLEAAGWTVTGPTAAADGYTWVRASRSFSEPSQLGSIMEQVNGPHGMFRDWKVTKKSSPWSTSWTATGTVDLSKGLQDLSDPQLDRALGGTGYGGIVKDVEQREGQPIDKLVDVQVNVSVPGASRSYAPAVGDPAPVAVHVSSTRMNGLLGFTLLAVGVSALAAVLLFLRRRFVHRSH